MTRLSFLLVPGAPGHLLYPASLFFIEELDTNGLMSQSNAAVISDLRSQGTLNQLAYYVWA